MTKRSMPEPGASVLRQKFLVIPVGKRGSARLSLEELPEGGTRFRIDVSYDLQSTSFEDAENLLEKQAAALRDQGVNAEVPKS